MEPLELQPQFSHVVTDAETVRQRCHPIHNILVGVRYQALTERMRCVQGKVHDASYRILRHQRFLVQVHDVIVVVQRVHRVLQTILQRTRLEQSTRFGLVIFRHHNFADPTIFSQIDALIGDHFDGEILQTDGQACVHVARHIRFDQIGKVTARHNANANERRQQWTALHLHLVGKGIVTDETAKVEQHLRQREQRQHAQCVQYERGNGSVRCPRIDQREGVLVDFDAAREQFERDDDGEQKRTVQ